MNNPSDPSFEKRKKDHIALALHPENEAHGYAGLDAIVLPHEALPELNFDEISISQSRFGQQQKTPFFISSMTAGHAEGIDLNIRFAKAAAQHGWAMGVGSQRRQLSEPHYVNEWRTLRQQAPQLTLLGNIGISQAITSSSDDIQRLVDSLEAQAMIIHLNALQECIQPEGTPQFKGGLSAIERLCRDLPVPVIIKETGCGFADTTLKKLMNIGVHAVDISGLGGTHWGRIEGARAPEQSRLAQCAQTFKHWGISTLNSFFNARDLEPDFQVWASGGIRSGLDAAKLLAYGANQIGFAKPILQAALKSEETLHTLMDTIEYELRVALFCTGCKDINALVEKTSWE